MRLYKIEEFDTTVLAEVTTGANGATRLLALRPRRTMSSPLLWLPGVAH